LLDQAGRYIRLALVRRPSPRNVHAEHKALVAAALARDARLACRLNQEHIDRTVDAVAALIEARTPRAEKRRRRDG